MHTLLMAELSYKKYPKTIVYIIDEQNLNYLDLFSNDVTENQNFIKVVNESTVDLVTSL
jgi:hypothetical protein